MSRDYTGQRATGDCTAEMPYSSYRGELLERGFGACFVVGPDARRDNP